MQGELERERKNSAARAAEAAGLQLARLMDALAAPVAQLGTQRHLLEVAGKPVQAQDILANAKRIVRALEDHGLSLEGTVGTVAAFDPDRHAALAGAASLRGGEPVVIRFPAVAYRGKVLRRAGVEKAES